MDCKPLVDNLVRSPEITGTTHLVHRRAYHTSCLRHVSYYIQNAFAKICNRLGIQFFECPWIKDVGTQVADHGIPIRDPRNRLLDMARSCEEVV
jgi:hypothetical protein